MAGSARSLEIDGEGAFWAVAGFVASLVLGMLLRPLRSSAGLENVVVVYVIVVALTAAVGGRAAGLASSLSAALAYTWFFTTPYETLRIDSAEQVATVLALLCTEPPRSSAASSHTSHRNSVRSSPTTFAVRRPNGSYSYRMT